MKWFSRTEESPAKVFCVGFGKTGTTSLGAAFKMLSLRLASQTKGERLLEHWAREDFHAIIQHCTSADAFQDIPFFLPRVYRHLDTAFPGSKFVLSVRNSSDEWYESLVRFHMKIMRTKGLPTADDLKRHRYRHRGWIWRAHELIYEVDEHSVFARERYIAKYESHCRHVIDYFKGRSDSLLVLNPSDPTAMQTLCRFLDRPDNGRTMPHLNSSKFSLPRELANHLSAR